MQTNDGDPELLELDTGAIQSGDAKRFIGMIDGTMEDGSGASAAIWGRGTNQGKTVWDLQTVPMLSGHTGMAIWEPTPPAVWSVPAGLWTRRGATCGTRSTRHVAVTEPIPSAHMADRAPCARSARAARRVRVRRARHTVSETPHGATSSRW